MRKVIALDSKNNGTVRSDTDSIGSSLLPEEVIFSSALHRKVEITIHLKFPDGSESMFSFGDN